MNFYQFEPILIFCIFIWVFYLHGAFVSEKLQLKQQGVHRLFVNLSIGFSLVVFSLFFIALLQLFYRPFVSVFYLVIPLYYLYQKFKKGSFQLDFQLNQQLNHSIVFKGIKNHSWLIFVILYLIFPGTYNLFFPETISDAMRYHLPYAQLYAENHGLAVNEFLRYPVFAHNINMTFSLGYLYLGDFQGEVLARMFSLFTFILLVLGLYSLALRSFNKTTAVIAIVILIKAKTFRILMTSGYIDIGLALFLFSCLYFLYLWQQDKQNKWLYLSAFSLGVVLGTKYLGLLWLIPVTLWVFLCNKSWKNTYQFFFIALIIGSPWYIRNIFIAGNPLHPFLQDVFGYWLWTPEDMIAQKKDLLVKHGIDRTFWNFIKLPYLLETNAYFKRFHLGWFMVLGIPCLVFCIKMQKFYKYLAAFVLFNLIFWFYTSQIDRYLVPTLPFLALFAAYVIGKILHMVLTNFFFQNKYFLGFTAVILLSFSSYKLVRQFQKSDRWQPMPKSHFNWNQYNNKQNKYHVFANVLNQRKAQRVFSVSDAMIQNTFNGLVLGDWFGIANKSLIFAYDNTPQEIYKTLKQFETPYLLISKQYKQYPKVNKILKGDKNSDIILETDEAILYYFK